MTTEKLELGNEGENIACEFLKRKGYSVLERNKRNPWGEIDIITRAKDGTLVFVEVKTMSKEDDTRLQPEDQLTQEKMKKFKRAAELYANHFCKLINEEKGWRLDVITIRKAEGKYCVKHYENVF